MIQCSFPPREQRAFPVGLEAELTVLATLSGTPTAFKVKLSEMLMTIKPSKPLLFCQHITSLSFTNSERTSISFVKRLSIFINHSLFQSLHLLNQPAIQL